MENKSRKPLVIYSSLIFLVAIVMVVLAFLGQKHLEKTQLEQSEANSSISERATQISNENRLLMEMNTKLSSENDALTETNINLTAENEALKKKSEQDEKLQQIFINLINGNKSAAKAGLKGIYTEDLTKEQKSLYDLLVKKTS